jgi:hypothetical protein
MGFFGCADAAASCLAAYGDGAGVASNGSGVTSGDGGGTSCCPNNDAGAEVGVPTIDADGSEADGSEADGSAADGSAADPPPTAVVLTLQLHAVSKGWRTSGVSVQVPIDLAAAGLLRTRRSSEAHRTSSGGGSPEGDAATSRVAAVLAPQFAELCQSQATAAPGAFSEPAWGWAECASDLSQQLLQALRLYV